MRKEDSKLIKGLEEKLIGVENEADREMIELYRSLFNIQREFLENDGIERSLRAVGEGD